MKKTMTKLLALALALAVLMTLSLAACGKKDSGAADKVQRPSPCRSPARTVRPSRSR